MRPALIILLVLLLNACARPVVRQRWTKERSPETFVTRFETSKGSFDLEITRSGSPMGADRFYQLVKHGFFDANILFYRVVPKFVAQFGPTDSVKDQKWSKYKIADEPVVMGNTKGSISYARSSPETRGTQLFINLKDNPRLDTINFGGVKGFPAFGKVTRGMEVVELLYNGYADSTMKKFDTMYQDKPRFMSLFPKLDSVTKAYILKSK